MLREVKDTDMIVPVESWNMNVQFIRDMRKAMDNCPCASFRACLKCGKTTTVGWACSHCGEHIKYIN